MAQYEIIKNTVSHPGLLSVNPGEVIDKDSPIPLHHQLEVFLRQGIESGLFPPNETLPTEHEIQEYFDLSRTPIRQALAKLSSDGLVVRRRSRGTIVLPRPFEENLRTLAPFTEEVKRKGRIPSAKLIEFAVQQANSEDISWLNLRDDAQIYHVHRVRFIDDEPVGDIVSHIPVSLLPRLSADDFSEHGPNQSIYYVLEKMHGIKLIRATETFKAINSSPETAKLLNMPVGSAVLMRTRVTFDPANRAVALEYGLYRGVYRLEWEGREVSVDTSTLL
ncbi:MAG TPA: GntR family transcriptional regulator [Anaerolineae bacterium]|nr:GntR family transcriptional regulator [Anaerolineae bacterium]HMR66694.1 GntR family transcriptional regulator [Anaerolineae bacterium]